MAEITDEIIVEDSEDFKGAGSPTGIKDIALQQYSKCCIEGSKEMVSGGRVSRIIRGKQVIIEAPNQREVFNNCVKMMEVIMIPELLDEKKKHLREEVEKVDNEIANLQKKYEDELDAFYKGYEDKKWKTSNISAIENKWEIKSVELYRIKLTVFARLLKEVNYFDEGSVYS